MILGDPMFLGWEGHLVMVPEEEVELVPGEAAGQSWLVAVAVPRPAHFETG